MSYYSVTDNYNYKNMNFGEAMMLGAFGSLTGGCGMGSYGLGSYGMGGSLFNMMGGYGLGNMYGTPSSFFGMGGMGCCGMGDSYVGMQLGMMGMGMLFQGISNSIAERRAEKAATAKAATTAQNNIDALKAKQKALETEKNNLTKESLTINQEVPSGIAKVFPTESKACNSKLKKLEEVKSRDKDYYIENDTTVSSLNDTEIDKVETGEGENKTVTWKFNNVSYTSEADAKKAKEDAIEAAVKKAQAADVKEASSEYQKVFNTLKDKIEARLPKIDEELETINEDLDNAEETYAENTSGTVKLSEKANEIVQQLDNAENIDDFKLENPNGNKKLIKAYKQTFEYYKNQFNAETDANKKVALAKKAGKVFAQLPLNERQEYKTIEQIMEDCIKRGGQKRSIEV